MKKRILSMLLVIVMVLSMVPVSALAAGSITISGKNYMEKGASVTLTVAGATSSDATVTAEDGTIAQAEWDSTDPNKCVVTGLSEGRTKITVTKGSETASYAVAVYTPAAAKPVIDASNTVVDKSTTPTLTCTYEQSACDVFRWYSSDTTVADINYKGVLAPKKTGTTNITVFHNGQTSEPVPFTVTDSSLVLNVTAPQSNLYVGQNLTLFVTNNNGNSVNGCKFEMVSGSAGAVTVPEAVDANSNTCTITGKTPGAVTVKATITWKGQLYEGSINLVVNPLSKLTITPDKAEMYPYRTLQLTANVDGVTWKSSNEAIATVSNTGLVESKDKTDEVTITATKDGYETATCVIKVVPNAYKITDEKGNEVTEIKVGQTVNLQVLDKSNTPLSDFAWSVTGSGATVDPSTGVLTGNADSTITVTAIKGSTTVTQEITVKNNSLTIKAGDVVLNPEDGYSIAAGNTVKLTAVDSVTGEKKNVKWSIAASSSSYATVTENSEQEGELHGISATSTPVTLKISATGYDTVSISVTVRAKGTFRKLEIEEGELILNQGCHLVARDAANNEVQGVTWEIVSGSAKLEDNVLTVTDTTVTKVKVKATHPDYNEKSVTFNVATEIPNGVALKVNGKDFPSIPAVQTMIVGEKLPFNLQPVPATISFPDKITLTSENTSVVKVDGDKLVAVGPGETTLTARYEETVLGVFNVKVKATTEIVLDDSLLPVSPATTYTMLAGDELVLKAYLVDTASGNKINANVTWKLAKESDGDYARVEKNTLDTKSELLGKRTIELIASVDSTKYTAVPLKYTVNVVPRASAISLWVNDKKVNDKETTLNLNDAAEVAAGVTIVATISPDEAGQDVVWNITDDLGIYEEAGRVPAHVDELTGEFVPASLTLVPTSAKRSGTITVKAVAKDGTKVFATTTIHFAKLGSGNLKNAPTALRGGASLDLKPYLVQDKDLDDKSVTWSLIETDPDNDNVVVKNGKSMKKGKVIATISKAGKLTTKPVTEPTPITVKITGSDGNFAPHTITLYPATKSIKITDESYKPVPKTMEYEKLKDDRVLRLAATVKPDEADVWDLKWSSSDENIIKTVDSENGVFQIKDAGKVRIECKTTDGSNVKGYLYLVITKNSADVKITAPAKTLTSGESMNLKAKVLTANNVKAANQSVIWSIADEFGNETKAATIFPTGRVTAGDVDQSTKVVITATSAQDSSVSSTLELTILPNTRKTLHVKADGELVSGTYTMDCGEYSILEGVWLKSNKNATEKAAVDCTFFSSNESVATVEDGELDAVGYGTATITARCTDPQTGNVFTTTFTVRVMKTVKDITISVPDNRKYLRTGESLSLTATAWADIANGIKADNQTFSWTVKEVVFDRDGKESGLKDADYAAISANGKLTVKYVDYVPRIRVQAISGENNMVGEVDFTIYPQDECRLRFFMGTQEYTDILPVDYDSEFKPTVMALMVQKDSSGNLAMVQPDVTSKLTWTSDNKNVIEVGADGKTLTVKAIGKAKLTANYYNSSNQKTYQASITAVVNRTMGSIEEITQSNILVAGKSTYMRAVPANSNATNKNVLWYVDDAPGEAVSAEDVVSINRYTGKLSAKRGITDQIKVKVIAVPVDGSTEKAVEVTIYPLTTKVEIKQGGKVINGTTVLTKLSGSTPSFSATANPSGACQTFKWTSSNKRVAEINPETGVVTVKGVGKTVIKATAVDGSGKYARFTLRITK